MDSRVTWSRPRRHDRRHTELFPHEFFSNLFFAASWISSHQRCIWTIWWTDTTSVEVASTCQKPRRNDSKSTLKKPNGVTSKTTTELWRLCFLEKKKSSSTQTPFFFKPSSYDKRCSNMFERVKMSPSRCGMMPADAPKKKKIKKKESIDNGTRSARVGTKTSIINVTWWKNTTRWRRTKSSCCCR